MANTKITNLGALAEAPATGDLVPIVDISDTTMDAAGTDKKITSSNLRSGLEATANKGVASGYASLDGSVKVVENPANATATPTASKIPIADGSGKVDGWVSSASVTVPGIVEIATAAETTTGTDATRAVSPDGLAGSSIFGIKAFSVQAVDGATALAIGDGKAYFRVPASLNGMNIVGVAAQVIVKSSSGTPTVQIARGRQSTPTTDFTYSDVLSTLITIDATEYDSKDATAAAAINAANDDLATGDVLRIDVDVAGTGTKGLNITIECQLP